MTTTAVVIIIAVIVVAAAVAFYFIRQERSKRLRSRFGPEYEHAVNQFGNQNKAEEALLARQRRIEKINVRPLTNQERDKFSNQWHDVQGRFVDDPPGSIQEADRIVNEVMGTRGYPMADFENRAEDLSVDHPHVVRNYRAAHAIAMRREASTEDLRLALVFYRDLFDELLEAPMTTGPRRA
jgi:hypothetical protein